MNLSVPHLNLVMAWLGVVAGFLGGFLLGLKFHESDWLGGYGAWQRRLFRLAHISFFGLAIINFMFFVTANQFSLMSESIKVAGTALVIGAVSMPFCCVVMAHWPRLRALFLVPVLSLLTGGWLTLQEVLKL